MCIKRAEGLEQEPPLSESRGRSYGRRRASGPGVYRLAGFLFGDRLATSMYPSG
jgi:hypothetical protein